MNVMTEYIVIATNAYPALTARVKELEEENRCLRETLNHILSLAPDFTSPEVFYHAARDMALAALNKEPT